MISPGPLDWAVFWIGVVTVLIADLVLTRSGGPGLSLRAAATWSGIWIGLGLLFGIWVAMRFGAEAGVLYVTAYTLEKTLSVDNLFIFLLIFSQTGIPAALQHRALFWGIASALIMRAVLIGLGAYLLAKFHWVIYIFAALLFYAAFRMLRGEEKQRQLIEGNCALCSGWVARFFPVTRVTEGEHFLVRKDGRLFATPLLVALVMIEGADLVFALDSIPAVFAVTREPYLVYTSNVFALLGLRSLYFVLAGAIRRLRFLRIGLAVMLLIVAVKLLAAGAIDIPPAVSLAVIALIFTVSIVASRLFPGEELPDDDGKGPASCAHLERGGDVQPKTSGCEECLKLGERWVQLRMCLACGHVGCCDSSKHRHATAHFHATGHPAMRSLEPGEEWRWCYVDRIMAHPSGRKSPT
jgi:tellurite resistance protein TerC